MSALVAIRPQARLSIIWCFFLNSTNVEISDGGARVSGLCKANYSEPNL